MDDYGWLFGLIIGIVVIGFIIYVTIMLASALVAIAGAAGTAWGGGTAIVNYFKSFKENMIDSNLAAV